MSIKNVGAVALCIGVALGAGWVWGASGKAAVEREKRIVDEHHSFEKARAGLLDGRLALVGNDYAHAGASFAEAIADLRALQVSLREIGQAERAGRIEIVLSHLDDAREAAAAQNAKAWSAADAALQALKGIDLPD